MKRLLALLFSVLATGSAFGAPAPQAKSANAPKKSKAAKAGPSVNDQLKTVLDVLAAQQQQINELRQQLQTRDQAVQLLQQQLDQSQTAASQAQAKAEAVTAETANQQQTVTALRTDVDDLKQNVSTTALTLQETQKNIADLESPLAIHYKGITITPGGFLAAETVWRQRAEGADINTNFNAIPFPGSAQANMSEFYGSGRQSRISLLAEGRIKSAKLTGYLEADFLSAAVTSNNNQSNSYSLRQRQVWGQAALHSWTFTGGQMWSLVTETKKGLDNRTEALPMTIDPQYTLGFSWARQYGFRVTRNFGNWFWVGFSVENPAINSIGGGGFNNNFVAGSLGNSGGLYNSLANYSFNYAPDFIVKAAFEPGFGHYEVFGVLTQFRDRIYPCATAGTIVTCDGVIGPSGAGATNSNNPAGGVGANARVSVLNKHLDFGAHFLGGNGIERYGTGGLPDVTVHPDGSLVPLRGYQGLGTLELHSQKWDFYVNGGGEYAERAVYRDPSSGNLMGYGRPASVVAACTEPAPGSGGFSPGSSCKGDTRILTEGTVGFWYRLYNGPKGRLQLGPQYSYINRATWGFNGVEPKAGENQFFTSFRYYLP